VAQLTQPDAARRYLSSRSGRRAMMTGDAAFNFFVLLLVGLVLTLAVAMIGLGLSAGL